jgi:hypothetical protein
MPWGRLPMTEKHLEKTSLGERAGVHKRSKRRQSLDSFFQKNGVYDGKLFFSKDRVTYTFIFETEAVALHLDAAKQALFIRGHRVMSLDGQPQYALFLKRFRHALTAEPKTAALLRVFDSVLETLEQPLI